MKEYLFNKIKDNIPYYLSDMIHNSEILYQYGPYIAMNVTKQQLITCIFDPSVTYDKYPVFRLICDRAYIIKVLSEQSIAKEMKNDLIKLKLKINKENNVDNNSKIFRENTINNIDTRINSIRDKQKEELILESAMINYCPIVPYVGTISRYNVEEGSNISNINSTKENLNAVITILENCNNQEDYISNLNYLLCAGIDQIMLNNLQYLYNKNTEDYSQYTESTKTLMRFTKDFLPLLDNDKYISELIYFSLAYIAFNIKISDKQFLLDTLKSLQDTSGDLLAGVSGSVNRAMEALMNFDLPDIL